MGALRNLEKQAERAVEAVDVKGPTFLPYLLSKGPKSPRELLTLALKERDKRLVRSYRDWRKRLLADLTNGRVRKATHDELTAIANEVQREAAATPR